MCHYIGLVFNLLRSLFQILCLYILVTDAATSLLFLLPLQLFDTDSSLSASDALAVVVAVVVVSSCVLAVLTLTGGLRRGDAGSFGGRKYDSIAFGADRRLARLRQEGRMLTDDLVDEEGNRLGGKRAAMQYAANLRRRNNIAEMEEEEEVEEWMAEEGELGWVR